MKRFLLAASLTLAALVPLPAIGPAYACYCIAPGPERAVSEADVVVIGQVERVELPPPVDGMVFSGDEAHVFVTGVRYLKGSGGEALEFRTVRNEGSCGALESLEAGKRNVLFLSANSDGYSTYLCSGNMVLDTPEGQAYLAEVAAAAAAELGPTDAPPSTQVRHISGPGSQRGDPFMFFGIAMYSPWKVLAAAAALVATLAAAGFSIVRIVRRARPEP